MWLGELMELGVYLLDVIWLPILHHIQIFL